MTPPKSPPQPAASVEQVGLDIADAIEAHMKSSAMIWSLGKDLPDDWMTELRSIAVAAVEAEMPRLLSAAPPADGVPAPDLEALGEKLFILSDHLRRFGVLSDAGTHIAYEDVVGEFQKLSDAPKATTAPIGEAGVREAYNAGFDDGIREALRLARPIVEGDLHEAIEHCDADWEGMSRTALEAIDAALTNRAQGEGEKA